MKKRVFSLLLALLLLLLPLSACKSEGSGGPDASGGPGGQSGGEAVVTEKSDYYEQLAMALQGTFAELDLTKLNYNKLNYAKLDVTLQEITGLEQFGMNLPLKLPATVGAKVLADKDGNRTHMGVTGLVNGVPLAVDFYLSATELFISAPDFLSKDILASTEQLFGGSLGSVELSPEALALLEKVAAMPASYAEVIKNAVPAEAKTTETVEFETVNGVQSLKAEVVTLTGKQMAGIFMAVKEHAASDATLAEVVNLLIEMGVLSPFYNMSYINSLLGELAVDVQDEEGVVLKWVRPEYNGNVCADIVTVQSSNDGVSYTITVGYTEDGGNAKGVVSFDLSSDTGETYRIAADYVLTGNTRKLTVDLGGEWSITVDSVVTQKAEGAETKTEVIVEMDGAYIKPLTVTTLVKKASASQMSTVSDVEITIPQAVTGLETITVKFSVAVEVGTTNETVSFPADYAANVYNLSDYNDLAVLEEEISNAVIAILMAGQSY